MGVAPVTPSRETDKLRDACRRSVLRGGGDKYRAESEVTAVIEGLACIRSLFNSSLRDYLKYYEQKYN